jgi:hypothetical protein
MALFLLQNPADFGKGRGLCSELCPSSHDAYLAVSIKAEVPSDAEAEEDPLALTSPVIKAETEVSCVSESMLGRLHKRRYPVFCGYPIYELLLQ